MTPKEKAEELMRSYDFVYIPNYTCINEVKECALIAVDEILLHEKNNHSVLDKITEYWEEVKEEIQKL
jgi:hypothetical protein